LAAFGEVGVPEEAGGDGAEGLPRCAHFFEFFGRGAFAEIFYFLDGGGEREIAGRPNVGAAEGAEEINVGGPAADSFQGDEFFASVIVVKRVESVEIELVLVDGAGEEARIVRFLAAEAELAHLDFGELEEFFGSEGADGFFELLIERAGGCERDLLLENDVDESGKAGLANPERRHAMFFDDASEVGVACGEFSDGFGEKFFGYVDKRFCRGRGEFRRKRLR